MARALPIASYAFRASGVLVRRCCSTPLATLRANAVFRWWMLSRTLGFAIAFWAPSHANARSPAFR